MGGCQSSDARNAAIDANFPADSRHVMMHVKNDKELNKMQEGTKTSQPDFKPRAGYQPRAAYKPSAASSANGMSAMLEKKRAEQAAAASGQASESVRTTTNSDDEKDTAANGGAERRPTDTMALDGSNSSQQ